MQERRRFFIFVSSPVISGREKAMKQEKEFWLVTTGHLEDRLWFREEDDFKVGMNYVAVQAALTDVSILAFILR